jgi:hypothetical protein
MLDDAQGEGGIVAVTSKQRPTEEVGYTGLVRYGTDVFEEWHNALRGRQGVRALREMRDNDSTIGASLYVTDSLVRQVPWRVEPATQDHPQTEDAAEFLESCVGDMSHTWQDFMSEVLSFIWFGWSLFEKVYKRRGGPGTDPSTRSRYSDGKLGWRKIAIRAQETLDGWSFDEDGGVKGMWQVAAPNFIRVFIPIEKAILFRPQIAKNNPEGRSLLRNAYRSWFFLKRLQELEAIGIERDLVGLPVLHMPLSYFDKNAPQAKKQALADYTRLLVQIRRNEHEGVTLPTEVDEKNMPTGFKLELLSSGGSRALDISGAVERYEKRIAQVLLTQFLFLGMEKVGSFSLSSDMTSLFATALGAMLDTIEETFHRFATAELMQLNGYAPEAWPRLRHGDLERQDIRPLAEALVKLVDGGLITPDSTLEDYLRKEGRLPEREEGEPMPAPEKPAPSPGMIEGMSTADLMAAMNQFNAAGDTEMAGHVRRALAAAMGVPPPGEDG